MEKNSTRSILTVKLLAEVALCLGLKCSPVTLACVGLKCLPVTFACLCGVEMFASDTCLCGVEMFASDPCPILQVDCGPLPLFTSFYDILG